MPLSVVGAGFGRTGTMSTYAALNQLGFPCYHMIEVLENKANKTHLDFWLKVARSPAGAQHDWEQVFSKYTAAVDNPASCVWRELAEAYPDAKIILTLHPKGAEAWYESTIDTIYFTEIKWQFKVLEAVTPFARKMGEMVRKLVWGRAHRGTMEDPAKAIAFYDQHIEEVKASLPSDRLLVFSVDQGWDPLCRFLGVPVPEGEFPNVNDRAAIKKSIAGMTKGVYAILAAGLTVVAAAIYGIGRLFF